jgi:predicted lipoprotein with Yx(FWY)xxD motif
VVLIAAAVAGCGSSHKKHASASSQTSGTASAGASVGSASGGSANNAGGKASGTGRSAGGKGSAPKPAPVSAFRSQYGRILQVPGGHAVYVFTHDAPGHPSTCSGACAVKWPPVIVKQTPVAQGAVKQGLLGTVRRNDGTLQATYAGQPLYRYFAERDPGEVLCQGVSEFGGTWWVVAPSGRALHKQ